MKKPRYNHFNWEVALILLAFSALPCSGQADGNGPKPSANQVAFKLPSGEPEIAKSAMAPPVAFIEQVQAANVGHEVEIRVTGSSVLSCTPFLLTQPDRLVLDCPAAHTQVRSAPSRVDLYPVRSIRVGQFKTDVVRVVVDLEAQSPYSIHPDGNSVIVTFSSNAPKPLATEAVTAQHVESTSLPSEGPHDPPISTPSPPSAESSPPAKSEEPATTSAGELSKTSNPPQGSIFPTAVAARPEVEVRPADGLSKTPMPDGFATEPNSRSENLDSSSSDQDYIIGVQDVLAINVWRDPELSRSVPVRPDGKISLPLIGDIHVSGLTPGMLQERLTSELDAYIHKPQVTVIVQEVNSRKFYIMGQVEHPGTFSLAAHVTVLDALAMAGGFRDFAKVSQTYLLRVRPDGTRKRIPFDYKAAVNGKVSYRDIEIQTDDTLVVP
jgi:polysaccharide biosynthesis/export protein